MQRNLGYHDESKDALDKAAAISDCIPFHDHSRLNCELTIELIVTGLLVSDDK